jgi:hypothetical protein
VLALFGYSVFAFLFFGALWRFAGRWRYLAERYAADPGRPRERRGLQSAVLLGLGGYNVLKGILKVGVHDTGISLRILPPFNLFHKPLFVPFQEIEGWKTTWYLDSRSTELAFRRAPDVKMVVPADLAEWIAGSSRQKMTLHEDRPPQGNAGRGWYAFVLVTGAFMLVMLAILIGFLLAHVTTPGGLP